MGSIPIASTILRSDGASYGTSFSQMIDIDNKEKSEVCPFNPILALLRIGYPAEE